MRTRSTILALTFLLSGQASIVAADRVEFKQGNGRIEILVGGRQFATYVYQDSKIPRPCFLDVRESHGIKVTRNHPPQEGDDKDHPHHTGLFFTFGNLNGVDYWHLKGSCVHERFIAEPKGGDGKGTFTVANRYFVPTAAKKTVLNEIAQYTIRATEAGVLIEWDHNLKAVAPAHFGSKEEGGLAMRVATPIAISSNVGGKLTDSEGRSGGKAIWGKQAEWLDYSGTIDGRFVGLTVIPHPGNFSKCWYHARDYGLVGANPFGPLNTGKGRQLKPSETLRLRYGVIVHGHAAANEYDVKQAVKSYTRK